MANSRAFVIGVDPGISGAVALIQGDRFVDIFEMPTQKKSSGRSEIDEVGLVNLASNLRVMCEGIDPGASITAAVEQVSAMPGQGVSSMFSLGDSFGCARVFAALCGGRLERVAPVSWKKALGMSGKPKGFSVTRARALFPTAAPFLALKKDHGNADALLIAHFVSTYRT